MATMQLREELFREMNPLLDSDVMLRKMIAYVRSLFADQQLVQEATRQKARQASAVLYPSQSHVSSEVYNKNNSKQIKKQNKYEND